MSDGTEHPKAKRAAGLLTWGARFVGHLLGVGVVGTLVATPFVDQQRVELFMEAASHQAFREMASLDLLLFGGLSVCLWVLVYILFLLGCEHLRGLRQGRPFQLRSGGGAGGTGTRGSVMVETLIVVPILFVLIAGIAQLAIINIAGVFANLATFEAGRAVWVWEGEPCNANGQCDAEEMAKIQAAAVLVPVAPGDFIFQDPDATEEMEQMRGILVASQFPWPVSDSGFMGRTHGGALASSASTARTTSNFTAAFDTSSFMVRTARKFTFAYHAVDVDFSDTWRDGRPVLEIDLTYKQHLAFPFVQGLFGESDQVAGRNGFYSIIERRYVHVRQPEPNRAFPQLEDASDRGGVRLF